MQIDHLKKLEIKSEKFSNRKHFNTEIKSWFRLVLRFITNKYYKNSFFHLSFFLYFYISTLFLVSDYFIYLLTLKIY